jgi:hypothetical protein
MLEVYEDDSEGRITREISAYSMLGPEREISAYSMLGPEIPASPAGISANLREASSSSYQQATVKFNSLVDQQKIYSQSSGISAVRDLRRSLQPGEDLIVLIVCHGDIWQQVRTFVATLRQDYIPHLQPLVILAPTLPPPGMLEDCSGRVVCMAGSCLRGQVLVEAGVLEAGTVVVLAGDSQRHTRFPDYRMVLTGQELECWLGSSSHEAFTTFELFDSRSSKHLPRLRGKLASHYDGLVEWAKKAARSPGPSRQISGGISVGNLGSGAVASSFNGLTAEATAVPRRAKCQERSPGISPRGGYEDYEMDEAVSPVGLPSNHNGGGQVGVCGDMWEVGSYSSADEDDDDDERLGSGIEAAVHRKQTLWAWLRDVSRRAPVLEDKSHDSIMFDPRFAAGQIFSPELWGMMLGRMFYMPVVIEFIEALVLPVTRGQRVFPWQVRVPAKYIGRPFVDLLSDLASGVPLERGGEGETLAENEDNPFHTSWSARSPGQRFAAHGPPAVAFALYRLRSDFIPSANSHAEEPVEPASSLGGDGSFLEGSQQRMTERDVTSQVDANTHAMAEGIGGHHFMVLAPKGDTILRKGDWAIVLGGKRFGERTHENGLLRGSLDPDEAFASASAAMSMPPMPMPAAAAPKSTAHAQAHASITTKQRL